MGVKGLWKKVMGGCEILVTVHKLTCVIFILIKINMVVSLLPKLQGEKREVMIPGSLVVGV